MFLHGAAGAGMWLPFLEGLARRFTVYAPSHPGFGRSDDPEWLDAIDDLVHFSLDFLDDLGHPKVHLVGLSLGGWIAAELATVCFHRIARLVLVDAAGIRVDGVSIPDLFVMSPEEAIRTIFADPATAAAIYPPNPITEQLEIILRRRSTMARLAWNPYLHNPKLLGRLHRIRMKDKLEFGRRTFEELEAQGYVVAGSPETVAQRIRAVHAQLGFGILTGLLQFGSMPHDLTVRNMELFARKVMPELRAL